MSRLFGPPHPKPRAYPYVLEVLETQANQKLTSEYNQDIKKWLSVLEAQLLVNPQMIDIQPEIQWYMRPYLLDFLIELHSLFRLQPSTLFLCVNIIDRYCAKRIVFKRHYQLVGCTALWIAGKYEDKKLRVPTLRELAIMCRHAYDEEMFVQMEMHILSTLEWLLSHPLLEECLQLAITESGVSSNITPCKYNRPSDVHTNSVSLRVSAVTAVGRFFCELSLYNRFFLNMPPSLVAIASNLIACLMLRIPTAANHIRNLLNDIHLQDEMKRRHLRAGDDENTAPNVYGSFLLGCDEHAMNLVRRIVVVLLSQMGNLSDVVQRKFEGLGVTPVVHNFSNRHAQVMQTILDHGMSVISDDLMIEIPEDLKRAADIVMQLHSEERLFAPPPTRPSVFPATPPLATSQSSIFSSMGSSNYTTPILHSEGLTFAGYSPNPEDESKWVLPMSSKLRV